jgi:hypothetical protein
MNKKTIAIDPKLKKQFEELLARIEIKTMPRHKVKSALKSALEDSKKTVYGCGCSEFTVDGFMLYDRVKTIISLL